MVGRIVIMLAKIDPTILPACFRCQSFLRIGAEHLAVFNPRVFLSAGTLCLIHAFSSPRGPKP